MLVFIDDSGDAGFKLSRGSTRYFVISLLIFDDDLEAEKMALAIKELRRKLKFSDTTEFKFNMARKDVRIKFLKNINGFKFRIRSLVIDKRKIYSEELRNNKNSFYGYAIKTALKYSNRSIVGAKVKIDGSGDRIFRKSFLAYLRKQLSSDEKSIMNNCRLIDSKSNVLIQAADMIVGSIRRSYEDKKTDRELYRRIIKKHIEDEWMFK